MTNAQKIPHKLADGSRLVRERGEVYDLRVPYRLGTNLCCSFENGDFVHMGDMVEVGFSFPDCELSSVGKLESATYGEDGIIKGVEVREADCLLTYMPNDGVFYHVKEGVCND